MTELSAARFFYAVIGAVMITTIGIACLGIKRASAQADAPDYAALMAAPDRSDGDRQADKRRDPQSRLGCNERARCSRMATTIASRSMTPRAAF